MINVLAKYRRQQAIVAGIILLLMPVPRAVAAVRDVVVTDVTPRSFSVVWVSDVPVTGATVHVYAEPGGVTAIDGTSRCTNDSALACDEASDCAGGSCELVSAAFVSPPSAAANGVVKVTVVGLGAALTYGFAIETTTGSGTAPDAGGPRAVTTASAIRLAVAGVPIVSDLLAVDVLTPSLEGFADGALVLADVAGSLAPISAFVGDGAASPKVVLDLANLFDAAGLTHAVESGERIRLTEVRGLLSGDLDRHLLVRRRRLPAHEEAAALGVELSELETPAACFDACDFNCSGAVGQDDFSLLLSTYGTSTVTRPAAFHPDMDLNSSGGVGDDDVELLHECYGRIDAP